MTGPESGIRSLLPHGLMLFAFLVCPPAALGGTIRQVSGSYEKPDVFSLTNQSEAGHTIVELRIDLTGSSGAIFDRRGQGFQVTSSDAVGFDTTVGFDLLAPDVLRLVFDDFDAGETFAFTGNVNVTGVRFAGATLAATFASGGPLVDAYVVDPLNDKRATVMVVNPEPSPLFLVAVGLALLAAGRGGHLARGRPPRS